MKTLFRWLFKTMGFVVLLVVLLLVLVTLLEIPVDMTGFKGPIETLAGKALKRPVNIDQSIIVSTSLNPVFTLKGLRIGNAEGFSQETFVNLDQAKLQVELLPLLQKKVSISEISVQKLQLTLEENKSGAVNWVIAEDSKPDEKDTAKKEAAKTVEKPIAKTDAKTDWIAWAVNIFNQAGNYASQAVDSTSRAVDSINWSADSIVVKKLTLTDIDLQYYEPYKPEPSHYQIENCFGSMLPGKPMELDVTGTLLSLPYDVTIQIASLEKFLRENRSSMDIKVEIADTNLMFNGDINLAEAHRSLALKTKVSGENLHSLNDMLDIDLPPINPYSIEADLFMEKGSLQLKNLMIQAGSSSLSGTAMIGRGKEKIEAKINFTSPLIQVNDFIFDNWSWSESEKTSAADESDDIQEETETAVEKDPVLAAEKRKLLDPDILRYFDVTLDVRSEKVLLGDEKLGSGELNAAVDDGRIAINRLALNIPGGAIELSASVKPGTVKSDAAFKAVMSNFDIGIMARRANPESKMGGRVNLDVNLQSSASSFDQILASGNGYFDFSGELKNMRAGIIDLWAVNLIAAIISSTDENESNINCAVGRWRVDDGSLTPDVFFIDTGKIRICGSGQVDFQTNQVDMIISPTPKKPEFFSLATPLEVRGSFSDLKFGIKKGDVIGTAINFITSPLHVPIRRAAKDKIPKDGSDACTVVLGPENRSDLSVQGCE